MEMTKLGAIESRFADIVWANEPLPSGELAQICLEELHWKRTTTYTVLKKLSDRGLFQNVKGIVSSQISRQEYYSMQSRQFVDEAFEGSLPAFLAAFTGGEKLSSEEIEQLQRLIDQSRG